MWLMEMYVVFLCGNCLSLDSMAQMADVWSCGVTLYVMLVGAYPFEDHEDPKNFKKTMAVISRFHRWLDAQTTMDKLMLSYCFSLIAEDSFRAIQNTRICAYFQGL